MPILKSLFGRKDNPAMRSVFANVAPGQAIWTPKDYASLAEAGYKNCAAVFASVSIVAKTGSRLRWVHFDKAGNELEKSTLLALLARPNKRESGTRFMEKVYSFILLAGNSYLLKAHGISLSEPPKFLYSLRPDRMKVIPGNWIEPVAGWQYSAGSTPVQLKADDVLQITEFNPLDDWYGLSRVQVAAYQVDISNDARSWNKSLLQNNMTPSGVLNFEAELMEDDREKLKAELQAKQAGTLNAGRFLITEGKATWTPTSLTAKDLDWINGQKMTFREICSIFGVPSMLLGDTEATTYNNYKEARRALYEETVLPLADLVRDELNSWLVPAYGDGSRLDYDRDSIDALQEDRGQKWVYVSQTRCLSINEQRAELGFDSLGKKGDVVLVPISEISLEDVSTLVPLDSGGAQDGAGGAGGEDEGEEEGEGEKTSLTGPGVANRAHSRKAAGTKPSFWADPVRKLKLWKAADARARAAERSFKIIQNRYMRRQAEKVDAAVRRFDSVSQVTLEAVFDKKAEAEAYAKAFKPWYVDGAKRGGEAGIRAAKGELFDGAPETKDGWTFRLTPELEEELMQMVFNSGTKVCASTIDQIYETLLAAQNDPKSTIDHLAQQIWEQVDWMSPARSRLWAETESTKLENWSNLRGYEQTKHVEYKGWNCQMLATSRPEHVAMDGVEIKLTENFLVGGEQMYGPGDPAASAWNVCNCRCSTYPLVDKSEVEEPQDEPVQAELPQWKPSMTKEEADAWAKDSEVKETLNHNTSGYNAAHIGREGFVVGDGMVYGRGVYSSTEVESDYGPANLKLRILAKKIADYNQNLLAKAWDWANDPQVNLYNLSRGDMVSRYLRAKGYDTIRVYPGYGQTWYVSLDPKNVTVVK